MMTPETHVSESVRGLPPGIDAGFLRRVYWTSLIFATLLAGSVAIYGDPRWGGGLLLSATWSTLNLWALGRLIRLALRPSGRQVVSIFLAAMVKLPILYGLLILMILRGGFTASALLVGFSIPFAVIILKAIGQQVAPRVALPAADDESQHTVDPS